MSELYQNLMQGMQEMEEYLQGKRTLRTETLEKPEPIEITPVEVKAQPASGTFAENG